MPVCVAGMHRSGTSMVTKFLHECGLYLGPDDDLMPPAEENPEGFWENLTFVDVNEEILNQLGGGWDCPPPAPADWTGGRLAPLVARAETILEHFAGREPWGWKDPRSSLTLPFWKAMLPGLRVVAVVRHPLEVALSLRQRNGFSYALGLTLWQITYGRIIEATTGDDRILTHYDASFGDPAPEVRRLLDFLGMQVPDDTIAALGSARGLRHHRLTTQDLFDAGVSDEVIELYRSLCAEAGWSDIYGERSTVGRTPTTQVEDAAPTEPSPLELGVGRLARSAMDARVLRRELEEHQRSLAGRQERVEELERALTEQQVAREERDARIAILEERLDERVEVRIADREDRINELNAELAEVASGREAVEREAAMLQRSFVDQAAHLRILEAQLETLARHESELRALLASAHEQLLHRDAEISGTVGAALHPHAPGAPAAIHYRKLIDEMRSLVAAHVPSEAPLLVVSGGDEAMLGFDGRPARHFPTADGVAAGNGAANGAAVAELETWRRRGAGFLVVPAPGRAWLARHPDLQRYLEDRAAVVVRDQAVADVYALAAPGDGVP